MILKNICSVLRISCAMERVQKNAGDCFEQNWKAYTMDGQRILSDVYTMLHSVEGWEHNVKTSEQ